MEICLEGGSAIGYRYRYSGYRVTFITRHFESVIYFAYKYEC
jgi:hypothetical protein